MKNLFAIILLSLTSHVASASEFADYCYEYEHNLAENNTLRRLYEQFDVGDCLAIESIITNTNQLDLSYAGIIDVKPFQYMHSVVHLDLSNNRISDVVDISRAYQLETLDLSNNNIYDFTPLIKLTQLKKLTISNNPLDKNESNCPTDSGVKALTFACFNVEKFESQFYISDDYSFSISDFESALNQIFEDRRVNFNQVINLNAFTLYDANSLDINIKGRNFTIENQVKSSNVLKVGLMLSGDLLKIEFQSPSGDGIARFVKVNGQFVIKSIEEY